MAAAAQIAANRRNARGSTGPRTAAGKAAASRNARRHGLTARRHAVPEEDAERFESFRSEMRRDLAPRGDREECLVEIVIRSAWRRRRAACAEAALFKRVGTLVLTEAQWTELVAIQRHEVAADRAFYRALQVLERRRTESETAKPPRGCARKNRFCETNPIFGRLAGTEPLGVLGVLGAKGF